MKLMFLDKYNDTETKFNNIERKFNTSFIPHF